MAIVVAIRRQRSENLSEVDVQYNVSEQSNTVQKNPFTDSWQGSNRQTDLTSFSNQGDGISHYFVSTILCQLSATISHQTIETYATYHRLVHDLAVISMKRCGIDEIVHGFHNIGEKPVM